MRRAGFTLDLELVLLAFTAFFLASPSRGVAQSLPIPGYWLDGLAADECYVMADPLGLDANHLAARPLQPIALDLAVDVRDQSEQELVPASQDPGEQKGAATAEAACPSDEEPAEVPRPEAPEQAP